MLAIQRQSGVDEPGLEDVYEIGVLAQLLELERLGDGTLKVLMQAHRRVAIRRFDRESGAFEAEVADVSEGMPVDGGVPVVTTLVCFFILHARLRVRTAHPAFPAPSVIEGHCLAKLGRNRAARMRVFVWLFEI